MRNVITRPADAIAKIAGDYPDLSAYGFRFASRLGWNENDSFAKHRAVMAKEDFADQVNTAVAYLAENGLGKHGSYALKHRCERWGDRVGLRSYVSNGAAIVAAIMMGYMPVIEANSPNCLFRPGGKHFEKNSSSQRSRLASGRGSSECSANRR